MHVSSECMVETLKTVSGTLFQLLLRSDHVDHKGVVGGVEAADGDAGGKEDGQDEVEV